MNELNELVVTSGQLRVDCFRLSDRIGHRICCSDANSGLIELLRSVEGDSTQDIPPSGPMQEMVAELASVGKPPVLMGLGAAGKSHWSCSIEADLTIEAIAFDFACKTRSEEFFGSTYQVDESVQVEIRSDNRVHLLLPDGISYCLQSIGNSCIQSMPDHQLRIISPVPDTQLPSNLKTQRRWRYAIGPIDLLVFASQQ